jgi:hypothetical protein
MRLAAELRHVFARTLRASRSGHRFVQRSRDQESAEASDIGVAGEPLARRRNGPDVVDEHVGFATPFWTDNRRAATRTLRAAALAVLIVRFTARRACQGISPDHWLHATGPIACRAASRDRADAGRALLRVLARRGEVAAHDLGLMWSAPGTRTLSARVCSYSGMA